MASLDGLLGLSADGGSDAAADATQSRFISTLFQQLVSSTRAATALPDADEFRFLAGESSEFAQKSAAVQGQLLNLLGLVSDAITHKGDASMARNRRADGSVVSGTFSSKADSLDRFHQLSDTVDTALEAVDLCLDEHRGVKRGNTAMGTGDAAAGRLPRGANQFSTSSTMLKPQRHFAHLIDNSTRDWIPILTTKPNAMRPLDDYESMRSERESRQKNGDDMQDVGSAESEKSSLYPHPYKHEIDNIDYEAIRARQLVQCQEQLYAPLAKVPCTWVDSVEVLGEMADELDAAEEIAIDLEHHSFRTYLGITCLMQISTRKADYLVDTLALRAELHRLNTSFTNPAIVKVLHGSDSDILWLQRDFGLYIVNLFDTGQAARVLEFQSFGLAYMLKHFCDVTTDKKYQLADWRVRPLSAEMLLYARMDTHYLLYMYDRLKNDLIGRSTDAQNQFSPIRGVAYLLATVLERSKTVSLKVYEKEPGGTPAAAREFALKQGVPLRRDATSQALVALFALRDSIARAEDESAFFVCSNPNLLAIAAGMPADAQKLESLCTRPVPLMVRAHAAQVLAAIADARARGTPATPVLASATGSPNNAAVGVGHAAPSLDLAALHTPQKFGKASVNSAPIAAPMLTPATAASALFAQLSTSGSTVHAGTGWVSQALADAAPIHSSASAASPVMSTDQLYSSANWTAAAKNLERSLSAVRSQPAAEHLPRSSVLASMSPAPKSSPFAMLATRERDGEADANRAALAAAHAALSSAPVYQHAISALQAMPAPAPLATPIKPTAAADAAQMDVDDDRAMLRTPNTGEPDHSFVSPSPMSLQVIPSPVTVPGAAATVPAGFTSIAGDVPVTSPSGAVDASPLPKSMREIYKISNENRRKKKKVKTAAAAGGVATTGDADEEDSSAPTSANASRSASSASMRKEGGKKGHTANASSLGGGSDIAADGTSSHEFMKNIGWSNAPTPTSGGTTSTTAAMHLLNNTGGAAAQQPQQPNSAASYGEKKRKHSSAPASGSASLSSSPPSVAPTFHAFDYTHATLPPSAPSATAFFNPYLDMGRDKAELKAAAGLAGPTTAANKIYKGHTQLKNQGKSVTVRMDDNSQRQRGGSASSGIPIPRPRR